MAQSAPNRRSGSDHGDQMALALGYCPICYGTMEVVYSRNNQNVCVCVDCRTGVTVPATAWEIVSLKREGKWKGSR
jgi:hypothetical protein